MLTFDQFFDSSVEMMLICDRSGKILRVNDKWEEKLGFTKEELINDYFLNFVHPEDVSKTLKRFDTMLRTNQDSGFINRYMKKDASHIFVEWDVHMMPDFIVAQAKDVTERERLRQEHEENEERLRLIFDSSKNLISLLRVSDQMIVECNSAVQNIVGLPREQIIGKYLSSYMIGENKDIWSDLFDKLLSEGRLDNYEMKFRSVDGTERIFLLTGRMIEYDFEPHFMLSANEVTELRKKERALRSVEKRYAQLFENMHEGFVICKITDDGKDLEILQINRSFLKQTGLPEDKEVEGKKWTEIFPGARQDVLTSYIQVGRTGVPVNYEVESPELRKWFHGRVYSPETGIVAIIFEDISVRKEEHNLVVRQKAELEKATVEKDKVFSMLVHDLRSPFHGLVSLSAICKEDFDELTSDEMRKMANQMSSSITGVYTHMNELLEWIMLRRGIMEFRPVEVDLYKIADRVEELLRGSIDGKNITFKVDGAPGLKVMGDQKNIESIISNLVSNAIKFTPKGGNVTVSFLDKGGSIVTAIADTGIGIPAEVGHELLTTEKLLKRRGTEGEASSGLGLDLCKELIELNDGKFWFESTEGEGSIFYFSLPTHQVAQ